MRAVMTNEQTYKEIQGYLYNATEILAIWLDKYLPRITRDWWTSCVIDNLSDYQREHIEKNNISKLSELDLAALLRLTDKCWFNLRDVTRLSTEDRNHIREMLPVRNQWAHGSTILPKKELILRDVDTVIGFCEAFGDGYKLPAKLRRFRNDIENEQFGIVEQATLHEVHSSSKCIQEKSTVYLIGEPTKRGMVFSINKNENTAIYKVFIDGEIRDFFEGQIALIDEAINERIVDVLTLQSEITAHQIKNPSINSLYSLNAARIDFVPYQFRPALKIIKADRPRILIADGVGVGKTIEAGLILRELQARSNIESVLIICPKPLVAERKWYLEMKRFDEEFRQLNGSELSEAIKECKRDEEWPDKYKKAIIPYSLCNDVLLNGVESGKKLRRPGLIDLDPPPKFDLVIVDEAHNIRNSTRVRHHCVKYFCDNAEAVVFLTATPIQMHDDDLYTLLNVLRPDVILNKSTFSVMSAPNPHINAAVSHIRSANEGWQTETLLSLEDACQTQWGTQYVASSPTYRRLNETLRKTELTQEERVEIISDAESLHSFSRIINRTRRQDIQDFCIRRPSTLEMEFTDFQQHLYDMLLEFEATALALMHGNRGVKFMMSTIRRQASSCLFGLAPFMKAMVRKRLRDVWDDPELDFDEIGEIDLSTGDLHSRAEEIINLAENLPDDDPKFEALINVIMEKQGQEKNKIMIFSTFRHTLFYLAKKLNSYGLRVGQVNGSVKDDERLDLRKRFEKEKNDTEAIDILLFTEVGSEGLDYQFCDMLVNYDLPWNPMRIEQRIGRIDRRGQQSEVVNIVNVITSGTIDADIYYRCLMRIGIFEQSIGECSAILGEITKQINEIALDTNLTEEERRFKLAQMSDNEIRKLQELKRLEEGEKQFFGFDLSTYVMDREVREAENPWVTGFALQRMIEQYLSIRFGSSSNILGEKDLKVFRMSKEDRFALSNDLRSLDEPKSMLKGQWEKYLKGNNPNIQITFDSECAEKNFGAMLIMPVHPLAKQAAAFFKSSMPIIVSVSSLVDGVVSGSYPFSIYSWSYIGYKPSVKIIAVCENEILQVNMMELLQSCQDADETVIDDESWKFLENKHHSLWNSAREEHKENAEQDCKFKITGLQYSHDVRVDALEKRINNTTEEKILRLYRGQLRNVNEDFSIRSQELMNAADKADIHTMLLVRGVFKVR